MNIHCIQLSLYSVLKSDEKDAIIYWMGKPSENKYHLSEEDLGKIIESPTIIFELAQEVVSTKEASLDTSNIYSYLNKKEI